MRISILDFETSFQIVNKKKDPSPYNPKNFIVSYGLQHTDWLIYNCVRHNQKESHEVASINTLKNWLTQTDLLIAFNAKFELSWLKAIGIDYKGKIADPMIMAYVLARGQKWDMSLESLCIRFGVTQKKSDLVNQYMKDNISFENIPWDIIEEYGRGDVISTNELYLKLKEIIDKEHPYLWPTIDLMHEFCHVLTDMEYSGIKIDLNSLKDIEDQYRIEYNELEIKLQKIIKEVMGDTPFNLNSPEQMSQLIYSRKVNDKKEWKRIFNLGTELRGSVIKPKHPPKMTGREFTNVVLQNTSIVYKQDSQRCDICCGKGRLILEDARFQRKIRKCKVCSGTGLLYISSKDIGGFKFAPRGAKEASAGGFSTDKHIIAELSLSTKGAAKDFFEYYLRYSALDTYLGTFIDGIKAAEINSFIHTSFMQCVTATGRLSSRNPNFQNMPRGTTFEVKKAIVSRFPEGFITEADARQLEFRIAGELSGDKQIFKDVIDGVDVHANTAKATGLSRQDSKSHTFAPVYGAVGEGKPIHISAYYDFFKEHYSGLCDAHQDWARAVLVSAGLFRLPSGREYYYPNTKRFFNGSISNSTIIKNYPVQGFATADIIPLWAIEYKKLLVKNNCKSMLINIVHDSLVTDTHPDEKKTIKELLVDSWEIATQKEPQRRWRYTIKMPLEIETKQGTNWLEMHDV